ncbi:hypothetical protein NDU88_004960 [Pleurodeles waltl]|uniref:Uncharacterized protein n=1 Tax=Pleurodeles waltl TaxID=8319 RepID=A0AAV7V6M8_PLEWA|nr:hypothetical protein NDU88_004960 [Pleurodeles waltl]
MEGPGCPEGAVMGRVREPDLERGPPDPSTAGEKPQCQGVVEPAERRWNRARTRGSQPSRATRTGPESYQRHPAAPRDRAVKHRGLQKRKAEPAGTALTTQRGATAKQADSITAQKLAEIGTAIRSANRRVRSVGKGGGRLSFADTVPWFNSYASQVTRRRRYST